MFLVHHLVRSQKPTSSTIILGILPVDPPAYLEMLQQAVGDTDQASLAGVMKIRTHSLKHLAKIITDDYEMGWGIII